MKTIPSGLATHFGGAQQTLALCWIVTKNNGAGTLRGTEHDRDVSISSGALAGDYIAYKNISGSDVKTSSDFSVDNLDVAGVHVDSPTEGITVQEIEAGALSGARVTVFTCNWAAPNDGQVILRRGFMGEVSRDSDGKLTTEVRGLAQILTQQIGRILSDRCDVVRFGDARCGFDLPSISAECTVTVATSRKEFTLQVGSPNPVWEFLPPGGEIEFLTGDNASFEKEVKAVTFDGVDTLQITLYEEMAGDVLVGDSVEFRPGCDRIYSTCKLYDNLVNFRGFGVFVPGALALMRGAALGDCTVTLPDGTPAEPTT
jgi:uncharacterized phage protein (TIGR02218 family)